MGSETAKETTVSKHEDIKIMEEAKTQKLLSPSQVCRSSSSHAMLGCNINGDRLANESIPKSKSDGDLSHVQEFISKPASPPQSPTTSPPVQTMVHPSGFDPNRIPASVFSSKPANASEWSMASNDSLFSIHMGNSSFTRNKSGELTKIDEWNSSESLCVTEAKPNELCSLPPLMEVPANEEGSGKFSDVSSLEKEEASDSPKVDKEATTSRLSNESSQSSKSFAFPVLAGDDGGKASPLQSVEEKPEVQTEDAKASENPTTSRWFSCLSCWRCC